MNLHSVQFGTTPIELIMQYLAAYYEHMHWEFESETLSLRYNANPTYNDWTRMSNREALGYLVRAERWDQLGRPDPRTLTP